VKTVANLQTEYLEHLEDMKLEYLKKLYGKYNSLEHGKEKLEVLKKIIKNKGEVPELKKLLNSNYRALQSEAYKYLYNINDVHNYKDYVLKGFISENDKVRKMTFDYFAVYGDNIDFLSEDALFHNIQREYNPNIHFSFVKNFMESRDEEKVKKLKEVMKDNFNEEIVSLFNMYENHEEILKDPNSTNKQLKEAVSFFVDINPIDKILLYMKELSKTKTKRLISKHLLKLKSYDKYSVTKIDEYLRDEQDLEVKKDMMSLCYYFDKQHGLNKLYIQEFIDSNIPKYVCAGLDFAKKKDEIGYLDYAREILNTYKDENILNSAIQYLLYFQDYSLQEYFDELFSSKSKKLKSALISIISKLKLTEYADILMELANDKKMNSSVRRKALNTLIKFKYTVAKPIFSNISQNEDEDLKLREVALKGILYLDPVSMN
jgi:hypothetical protein